MGHAGPVLKGTHAVFLFVTVVAGAAYLLSQVILRLPILLIYAAELSAS